LGHNAFGAPDEGVQVVDRPMQPTLALAGGSTQRTRGVADHRGGLTHRHPGDPGDPGVPSDPLFRSDVRSRHLEKVELRRDLEQCAFQFRLGMHGPRVADDTPDGTGSACGNLDART
jgi:hypothetical protein